MSGEKAYNIYDLIKSDLLAERHADVGFVKNIYLEGGTAYTAVFPGTNNSNCWFVCLYAASSMVTYEGINDLVKTDGKWLHEVYKTHHNRIIGYMSQKHTGEEKYIKIVD